MTDNVLGAGDVTIRLDGQDHVLSCTWKAAYDLNRINGGLASLYARVLGEDIETIATVVSIGTGLKLDDDLRSKVFSAGVYYLMQPCGQYLIHLNNGGRPPVAREGGSGESDEGSPQS